MYTGEITPADLRIEYTYEGITEHYAAYGWGCTCCGQLTSETWWSGTPTMGDIYCLACKLAMWKELRVVSYRYPTRAEAGLTAATVTPVHDPTHPGWDYHRHAVAGYARLHSGA